MKAEGGRRKAEVDLSKPWAGMVPLASVVRNPEQPRVKFPKDEIARLALSLTTQGQTSPCVVMPVPERLRRNGAEWLLVDGECRWRAAKAAGVAELLVCYQPGVTEGNLHLASFAANFCRTPHTKEETALAIDKEIRAGRTYEAIAATVGKTDGWAKQFHAVLKLHPQLIAWLDEPDPETGRKLSLKNALLLTTVEDHATQMAHYMRARKLTSGEQYHKLRNMGVVRARRSINDDREYLMGLLSAATMKLNAVANAGEVMLRRLSAESMGGLQERLEAVQKACVKVRARFEKHTASGEGGA